ncbi:MAG: HAD-IA family hydrolase [Acidimicrobiales bacterium]
MGVRAALFDFGGVLTASPFEQFARYEASADLPPGFVRRLNGTNPDTNAWAQFERGQIEVDEFCALFESEARAAGGTIEARAVLACLEVEPRPMMLEAVRRCHERLKTALLTNTTVVHSADGRLDPLGELFDLVIESTRVGVRKPETRFYELALEQLDVAADEAVFLDDLGVNLKPARDMGMVTIKVDDPEAAIAELEAAVGFPLR